MTGRKAGGARAPREDVSALFVEYRHTREPGIRTHLILRHISLVRLLAAKFAGRGEPLEDLVQVGAIGLIRAVDRFEPERGTKFSTYATPTIVGEIRRYFRDKAWTLKPPRHLQELSFRLIQAKEALSQQLGRSPTIPEIAAHAGTTEEETLAAMELCHSYEPVSLDSPCQVDGTDTASTLRDELGADDPELYRAEAHVVLQDAMDHLDQRQRQIIHLRFFQEYSQTEVAERLQISQMHVSRLERRALRQFREFLEEAAAEELAVVG